MYNFQTVIGTQTEKPAEVDTTSSQYVVYIRTDIEPYEIEGEGSEEKVQGWKYKECVVPNNKYLIDQINSQQEAIDALMLGMADLYEMQAGV